MTASKGVGRGRAPAVLAGERYGRLTVAAYAGSKGGARTYFCSCECGAEMIALGSSLRKGHTRSCGCLKSELCTDRARAMGLQVTHGLSRHPDYVGWQTMHRRCEDPGDKSWGRYGGRGITACPRWSGSDGFPNFLADMGPRPEPGWHLHRIDSARGYEPGNCEWLSPSRHYEVHHG